MDSKWFKICYTFVLTQTNLIGIYTWIRSSSLTKHRRAFHRRQTNTCTINSTHWPLWKLIYDLKGTSLTLSCNSCSNTIPGVAALLENLVKRIHDAKNKNETRTFIHNATIPDWSMSWETNKFATSKFAIQAYLLISYLFHCFHIYKMYTCVLYKSSFHFHGLRNQPKTKVGKNSL